MYEVTQLIRHTDIDLGLQSDSNKTFVHHLSIST